MRYAFSYPTQSICCAQHLAEIRRRRSTYERKVYRSPCRRHHNCLGVPYHSLTCPTQETSVRH